MNREELLNLIKKHQNKLHYYRTYSYVPEEQLEACLTETIEDLILDPTIDVQTNLNKRLYQEDKYYERVLPLQETDQTDFWEANRDGWFTDGREDYSYYARLLLKPAWCKKYLNANQQALIADLKLGSTQKDISRKIGRLQAGISIRLKQILIIYLKLRKGLNVKGRTAIKITPNQFKSLNKIDQKIVSLYQSGMSPKDISNKHNINYKSIAHLLYNLRRGKIVNRRKSSAIKHRTYDDLRKNVYSYEENKRRRLEKAAKLKLNREG